MVRSFAKDCGGNGAKKTPKGAVVSVKGGRDAEGERASAEASSEQNEQDDQGA